MGSAGCTVLYALLDPDVGAGRDVLGLASKVLDGGATWLQLRAKNLPDAQVLELGTALVALSAGRAGVWINDRADLAALCGAYGVHVGQEDLTVAQARKVLRPGQRVGVSTHDLSQVERAVADGADVVAFGPVFASPTKQGHAAVTGPEVLREVRARAGDRPVVAIGGITAQNAAQCLAHGATHVAVIGALAHASDPKAAARAVVEACLTASYMPDTQDVSRPPRRRV